MEMQMGAGVAFLPILAVLLGMMVTTRGLGRFMMMGIVLMSLMLLWGA
jgi:hypothetical protein